MAMTIYVERSGGAWEAKYWNTDEHRYLRFRDVDKPKAIHKAVRATGYETKDVKIINVGA